jgi:hypothetical protein
VDTALVQYQNLDIMQSLGSVLEMPEEILLHLIVNMMTDKLAVSYFNECSCPWSLCNPFDCVDLTSKQKSSYFYGFLNF